MLFFKGLAMGAADVVPGVSGGTIAFITGIYAELIDSITAVTPKALKILFQKGFKAAWEHINGTFLLVLGSGILVAIVSLAKLIHYLLEHYPIFVWSFFFGLIIASCWYIGRSIGHWRVPQFIAIVAGTMIAAFISLASPVEATPYLPVIFLAGSIAVCAMILPDISGSFILLLMGSYAPIMGAIHDANFVLLGTLALGAVLGLLLFSHFLKWLLSHHEAVILSLLTGFMLGSLVKVWPWKETLLTRIDSHGEEVPFIQANILPVIDVQLAIALMVMLLGAGVVFSLETISQTKNIPSE